MHAFNNITQEAEIKKLWVQSQMAMATYSFYNWKQLLVEISNDFAKSVLPVQVICDLEENHALVIHKSNSPPPTGTYSVGMETLKNQPAFTLDLKTVLVKTK